LSPGPAEDEERGVLDRGDVPEERRREYLAAQLVRPVEHEPPQAGELGRELDEAAGVLDPQV
jgi:hypothetical protein